MAGGPLMIDDLRKFLTERYAEREDALRVREGCATLKVGHADSCCFEGGFGGTLRCDCGAVESALADVMVQQALLDWYGDGDDVGDGGEFLQIAASAFLNHPDYQEAWRADDLTARRYRLPSTQ